MNYKVDILPGVKKDLKKIEPNYSNKIKDRIDFLEKEPRHNGSLKLKGKKDTYRTRVGKYRIIYTINDKKVLVLVIGIDHRKDVYR